MYTDKHCSSKAISSRVSAKASSSLVDLKRAASAEPVRWEAFPSVMSLRISKIPGTCTPKLVGLDLVLYTYIYTIGHLL